MIDGWLRFLPIMMDGIFRNNVMKYLTMMIRNDAILLMEEILHHLGYIYITFQNPVKAVTLTISTEYIFVSFHQQYHGSLFHLCTTFLVTRAVSGEIDAHSGGWSQCHLCLVTTNGCDQHNATRIFQIGT